MVSSDDEDESVPRNASNYYFVNDENEPISFSELPVQWTEGEGFDSMKKQIFLRGTTDDGLEEIYKQVVAWKYDLSSVRPGISVLTKENNWIRLQKPRKSFRDQIRTTLLTLHCMHFLKNNPKSSRRNLWGHLSKRFSFYDVRPSEKDLLDHIGLISKAVEMDQALAKSKFLDKFLKKPSGGKASREDTGHTAVHGFLVDDGMAAYMEDGCLNEEDNLYDSVCAICDNGGELLCCEGRCLRSFHGTLEAGADSMCESLGLSPKEINGTQSFLCKNCRYKQHQCFGCGELGSSDEASGAEVFTCVSDTCGRFYHPHCVAKLLHREGESNGKELEMKIAAGEPFTCPVHTCCICNQGENHTHPDLQFAICRRCPKAYHRKCLPRKIAFEDNDDKGITQRAWEGLIPNRILIYCLNHSIDEELSTPARNHIKFPHLSWDKKRKKTESHFSGEVVSKGKSLVSDRMLQKSSSDLRNDDYQKKKCRSSLDSLRANGTEKDDSEDFLIKKTSGTISNGHENVKTKEDKRTDSQRVSSSAVKPPERETYYSLSLDDNSKRRILRLMDDAASYSKLEETKRIHRASASRLQQPKDVLGSGKVAGFTEAKRCIKKPGSNMSGCSHPDPISSKSAGGRSFNGCASLKSKQKTSSTGGRGKEGPRSLDHRNISGFQSPKTNDGIGKSHNWTIKKNHASVTSGRPYDASLCSKNSSGKFRNSLERHAGYHGEGIDEGRQSQVHHPGIASATLDSSSDKGVKNKMTLEQDELLMDELNQMEMDDLGKPVFQYNTVDFALAPCRPSSQHITPGWIDE